MFKVYVASDIWMNLHDHRHWYLGIFLCFCMCQLEFCLQYNIFRWWI